MMFLRTGKKSHKSKSRKEMTREKRGNNTVSRVAEDIANKMSILILLVSQAQSVHLQAQAYVVLQSMPKWTS